MGVVGVAAMARRRALPARGIRVDRLMRLTRVELYGLVGIFAVSAVLASALGFAQDKPAELKLGISTFTSGAASVFGVPGKAAAELLIEEINKEGGIGGVKLSATFVDEGIGGDKLLSEYRRLVQEQGVRVMLSAISSGNCDPRLPAGSCGFRWRMAGFKTFGGEIKKD